MPQAFEDQQSLSSLERRRLAAALFHEPMSSSLNLRSRGDLERRAALVLAHRLGGVPDRRGNDDGTSVRVEQAPEGTNNTGSERRIIVPPEFTFPPSLGEGSELPVRPRPRLRRRGIDLGGEPSATSGFILNTGLEQQTRQPPQPSDSNDRQFPPIAPYFFSARGEDDELGSFIVTARGASPPGQRGAQPDDEDSPLFTTSATFAEDSLSHLLGLVSRHTERNNIWDNDVWRSMMRRSRAVRQAGRTVAAARIWKAYKYYRVRQRWLLISKKVRLSKNRGVSHSTGGFR